MAAVQVLVFSEHATVREQQKHPGPANVVEALTGTAWCSCCDGSGSGSGSSCAAAAVGRRVRVSLVSPKRLVSALAKGGVHVLVLPGGSSARQSAALGTEGRAAVRAFVASGGGYVGICAGAFLAASHYEPGRSLALVRAAVVENGAAAAGQKARWLRGKAHVPVRLSATGAALLWREARPVAAVAAAGAAAAAAPGAEDEVVVGGGGVRWSLSCAIATGRCCGVRRARRQKPRRQRPPRRRPWRAGGARRPSTRNLACSTERLRGTITWSRALCVARAPWRAQLLGAAVCSWSRLTQRAHHLHQALQTARGCRASGDSCSAQ